MTIADYLNSKQFIKAYACWHYAYRVFLQDGSEVELDDDGFRKTFLATHEADRVEMAWHEGADGEFYAYAKITTHEE